MFGAQSTGATFARSSSARCASSGRLVVPQTSGMLARVARARERATAPGCEKSMTTCAPSSASSTDRVTFTPSTILPDVARGASAPLTTQ